MSEPHEGRRRPPRRRAVLAAAGAGLGTALAGSLSACSASGDSAGSGVTLTFSWWG
ncbi:carbohydrate ABC transporter substrate-binding protein, partial [Streptomyces sp. SID7982]|nr:carbohydrate ABC transporter substrate-binding protein [Streptomyces sp. SID7982]